MKHVIDTIGDHLWSQMYELKGIENKSQFQTEFQNKFRSWDKGDCSNVGLIKIFLWYVASIQNEDYYNEYNDLINYLQ